MAFLMKRYNVSVTGFPALLYDAHSPGSARVKAWHSYCSYRHVTFKEFMKISVVRRGQDPEGYGRSILVSGQQAYFLKGDAGSVKFVRPNETQELYSHPFDVKEAA